MNAPSLPILAHRDAIMAALAAAPRLVLVAAPGAGKTTQVPAWLAPLGAARAVWVLQPRRLAARLAAQHVAAARGEAVGKSVGYRVRFDDATGPATRLIYMTEGMLMVALQQDPHLTGVAAVVFDEFHQRSLAAEVGLGLLRRLQAQARPELQLVVMSATLAQAPVAELLTPCQVLEIPGRQYPVAIEHAAQRDVRPLPIQVAQALSRLFALPEARGDVLVFLPGVSEIERTAVACAALCARHGVVMRRLHGGLDAAAQDLAVRAGAQRRLILSTNVAETSVTVAGVTTVIDSGLHREASYSPHTGLNHLSLRGISQAAAAQRAGRAGRESPGRCWRLYTLNELRQRPAHAEPELQRLDLSEVMLQLLALGAPPLGILPLAAQPEPARIAAAAALLQRLGATDVAGSITSLGRQLARLPLPPRLGRLLRAAAAAGHAEAGAALAAWLSEAPRARGTAAVDLAGCVAAGRREPALAPSRRRLTAAVRTAGSGIRVDQETALARAALAAFPDRVAQRRRADGAAFLLSGGGSVQLPMLGDAAYAVVVAFVPTSPTVAARAQVAAAVDVAWLFDQVDLVETQAPAWEPQRRRVVLAQSLRYGALVLDASHSDALDPALAQPLLQQAARALAPACLLAPEVLARWRARLQLWRQWQPESAASAADWDEAAQAAALVALCAGKLSLAEVQAEGLLPHLLARLPTTLPAHLARALPDSIRLPAGRSLAIEYASDRPPWVAAPLQAFFGLERGPSLLDGRLPITLHLLGPHGRPLQVTQDLASFWRQHYPALRPALARRYPRHAWPEAPLQAKSPVPRPRGRPH